VLVLLTSAVLLLALGAGSALADAPAVQSADQSASTTQSASSSATAEQIHPTNSVVDIRIGSPGDNGAIEQSNSNAASSKAGNEAATSQSSGQSSGGSGVQSAAQHAATGQSASSAAKAVQIDPVNDVVTIRIHSDGKDGPVKQSNSNDATSQAGNAAGTEQTAGQSSGGGGGVQDADQSASTDQSAKSDATAKQDHPSNEVVRIRIHSAGSNGDVKQSNTNGADSSAGNGASTVQGTEQSQGAGGGTQYVGQAAGTEQSASSSAHAEQHNPSNSVESIRLHSPGDDGAITQSNSNEASSSAGNEAGTGQIVLQGSGSGHGVQASDQTAFTGQKADSSAKAVQDHPYNRAGGVRIKSGGGGGSISQSNANAAASEAGNAAETTQYTTQVQGGAMRDERSTCCSDGKPGKAVQAAGQSALTKQDAKSGAEALQSGATNKAGGVREDSAGTDGAVKQSNANSASSSAGNKAGTMQWLEQVIGAAHGKLAVQAAGQDAKTGQGASSKAGAHQDTPWNLFGPIRLASEGGHGSAGQLNDNAGTSNAGSAGATLQQLLQLL
jgi:hypothetical protein